MPHSDFSSISPCCPIDLHALLSCLIISRMSIAYPLQLNYFKISSWTIAAIIAHSYLMKNSICKQTVTAKIAVRESPMNLKWLHFSIDLEILYFYLEKEIFHLIGCCDKMCNYLLLSHLLANKSHLPMAFHYHKKLEMATSIYWFQILNTSYLFLQYHKCFYNFFLFCQDFQL